MTDDGDRAGLIKLLGDAGLTVEESTRIVDGTRQDDLTKIFASLRALEQHPLNVGDEGGVKVFVGSYHFPLGSTLYTSLVAAAALSAAGIALVVEPVSGSVGVVASVLAGIQQIGDKLTKLSPEEIVICEALLQVTRKKKEAHQPLKVSAAEVEAYFDEAEIAAPALIPDILRKLELDRVLVSETLGDQLTYSIVR